MILLDEIRKRLDSNEPLDFCIISKKEYKTLGSYIVKLEREVRDGDKQIQDMQMKINQKSEEIQQLRIRVGDLPLGHRRVL